MAAALLHPPVVPSLFTSAPALRDPLSTETSQAQDDTVKQCLHFLTGSPSMALTAPRNAHGVPRLDRVRHQAFLRRSLGALPAAFVGADASRPWIFYWALAGLATMGEDVQSYGPRLAATVRPMQSKDGGFGGGHGQEAHLAPTYAVLLSLAMVGGAEALDVVDRKAMWRWLGQLKQPDGGFRVSVGGEEDAR
jgi:protein farnesyltransferase subunit beta